MPQRGVQAAPCKPESGARTTAGFQSVELGDNLPALGLARILAAFVSPGSLHECVG